MSNIHNNMPCLCGSGKKYKHCCGRNAKMSLDEVLEYLESGNDYEKQGQYPQAIEIYTKIIKSNPKNIAAYYNRGLAYTLKEKYDLAIQDYSQAIALNPQDATAYNNRGNAYSNIKKYDLAIQDFDKAIKLNPQDATAYFNRGKAYSDRASLQQEHSQKMEYDNKARKSYKQAFEIAIQKYKEPTASLSLFRYCSIDINILQSLSAKKLWLASPRTFNDPFDSSLLYDIFRKITDKAKNNIELSLNNIGVISFQGITEEEGKNRGGIHKLMWGHYANAHKGMCMIYTHTKKTDNNVFEKVKNVLANIEYEEDRTLSMDTIESLFKSVFCVKGLDWQYENEWRIIAYKEDLGKGTLLSYEELGLKLTGIIFGLQCDPETREMVRSIVEKAHTNENITFEKIEQPDPFYFEIKRKTLDP